MYLRTAFPRTDTSSQHNHFQQPLLYLSYNFPQTILKSRFYFTNPVNMHSNTIISTVIAAIGMFATITSAECTVKWTDTNCCFHDKKARTLQDGWTTVIPGTKTGGEIRFADGNLCPDSVKATCKANCCDPTTGWGKGCPK